MTLRKRCVQKDSVSSRKRKRAQNGYGEAGTVKVMGRLAGDPELVGEED
jgi:hypothetical protein